MEIKSIFIITILVISIANVSANANYYDDFNKLETINQNINNITVAIYSNNQEEHFYTPLLKNYTWKVGQNKYNIVPTVLSTKEMLEGKLRIENFEVFIYSFNQADQHLFKTGFPNLPENKKIVKNIGEFIKAGGGYYGSCGACGIAGGMKNKPKSLLERAMSKSGLGITCVEFEYNTAIPILSEMINKGPESVDMQSYLLYSSFDDSNPHDMNYSGICPDVKLSKDNPIFDDFIGETRKIRWIGFPALEVPENPDRDVTVLARFPDEEISDNESAQIHYWTYTGGIIGLIRGLFTDLEFEWCKNLGILMNSFLFSYDWKKTDKIVKTYVADKPFMTSEIYPNENKARIIRCPGHPELITWWGGHLEDNEDTNYNNLYKGFYNLEDATPLNDTIEDEVTYNYCIIRRIVAWEAKIPDNDLPSVYGASQVNDITPYDQTSTFTIIGNTEEDSTGSISLELYYRYSSDNTSDWSDSILYATDTDGSDGWSWEFNAPNGSGYYRFYSIRNVVNGSDIDTETPPPGPDAIAYVH